MNETSLLPLQSTNWEKFEPAKSGGNFFPEESGWYTTISSSKLEGMVDVVASEE